MNVFYKPDSSQPEGSGSPPIQAYDGGSLSTEAQTLSSTTLSHWFEPGSENAPASKGGPRIRRRAAPGSDHVKHRRTRSGCYTCRSRRVKCDEEHPICKRCSKGSRECVYPKPPATNQSTSSSKLGQVRESAQESGSSSDDYEDEDPEQSPLGTQVMIGSQQIPQSQFHESGPRTISKKMSRGTLRDLCTESSSKSEGKHRSPSADGSSTISKSGSTSTAFNSVGKYSSASPIESQDLLTYSNLPRDLQQCLWYHQQHINYHHYMFKHDAKQFVNTILLGIAMEYEPLLYAVVGFAAYHMTLQKENGKIQDFLKYYNKSVQLLRKALQSGLKHTDATLLTILQLAAFEECLGDWVNLLSHQKAAYNMLLELYTPETVTETETRLKILSWYTRFDLFAGIMSGYAAVLGREWVAASEQYYEGLIRQSPSNLGYRIEKNIASHRLCAIDLAYLCAKLPRGEISIPEFLHHNELIGKRISVHKAELDDILGTDYCVLSFEGGLKHDLEDVLGPSEPGLLYTGPAWSMNFIRTDWYAIESLYRYQTALMMQQQPPMERLRQIALEQCKRIEAVEYWPESPPGAYVLAQSSLGLICLFLLRDEKDIMWCRRKLAKAESHGYIYPSNFRTKISELWKVPGLDQWWLPNEEGLTPILKSIRSFVEERTQKPSNQTAKDVKDMKAMFTKLTVDDSLKDGHEVIGSFASGSCLGTEQEDLGTMRTAAHGMQSQEDFGGWNAPVGVGTLQLPDDPLSRPFVGTEGVGDWIDQAEQGSM